MPAAFPTDELVTRRRIATYAAVGLVAAGVFMVVTQAVHSFWGTGLVAASALGFCASLVPSYLGHRRLTFRSSGPKTSEVPRFLVTSALCFGLTLGSTHFFASYLRLPDLAALVLTCAVVPVLNFLLLAGFVFIRSRRPSDNRPTPTSPLPPADTP
ncbi:MAG: GtrA family protein [Rubrivivax sp.]